MPLAGTLANGWVIPPGNVGIAGADLSDACGGGGVWPDREYGEGGPSIYSGLLDGNNEPMTGEKRWTITFKEPMEYLRAAELLVDQDVRWRDAIFGSESD